MCSSEGGYPVSSCPYCGDNSFGSASSVSIGGQSYKAVKIGCQTWMAKNADYNISGSKCYNDSETNCSDYGRLYNWSAARQVCPSEWNLPTYGDWEVLRRFAGGYDGLRLKAEIGWNSCGGLGADYSCVDTYGFKALPGGFGFGDSNDFSDVGKHGYWWSATQDGSAKAFIRFMSFNGENAYWSSSDKNLLSSVRCVK
jgi:uncharacterized protein (TIGR02145 family)